MFNIARNCENTKRKIALCYKKQFLFGKPIGKPNEKLFGNNFIIFTLTVRKCISIQFQYYDASLIEFF
jgi:hypothetical protein